RRQPPRAALWTAGWRSGNRRRSIVRITTRRPHMHPPDTDFDPDDNFANGTDPDLEIDEDAATETLVWQLLLLIHPGDEETALHQFAAYQDAATKPAGTTSTRPAY